MNSRSDEILKLYFNSWWLPSVFFLAYLAFLTIVTASQWDVQGAIGIVLLFCLGIAYLGIPPIIVDKFVRIGDPERLAIDGKALTNLDHHL